MKKQFQSKSVPRGTRTIWRYLSALFILFTFGIGQMWGADPQSVTFGTAVGSKGYVYSSSTVADATILTDKCVYYSSAKNTVSLSSSKIIAYRLSLIFRLNAPANVDAILGSNNNKNVSYVLYSLTSTQYDFIKGMSGVTNDVASAYVALASDHPMKTLFKDAGLSANDASRQKLLSAVDVENVTTKLYTSGSYTTSKSATTTIPIWKAATGDNKAVLPAGYYALYIDCASSSGNTLDNLIFKEVPKTNPTITFNNGAYSVGSAALDLSSLFSSNSDGAVTYSVKTDGSTNASISGTNFTATAAGTAVVTASQAATSTYNAATKDANIVVTVPSTPTHDISYTNLKGSDVSGYPTTYYEGTGVASFDPLADVADFHFNGWSPASIAADATTDQTISATWVAAYNVTFNAGEGDGTVPATFQKWEGGKFNLPGQGEMVAPSGKAFDGWKANGAGDKLAAGSEYTMGDAEVAFVAQWKNAPTTLFHYQWTGSSTAPTANSALTATGGTFTFYKSPSSSKDFTTASVTYHTGVSADMKTVAGTSDKLVTLNSTSNNSYLVTLTGNKYFEEGDTVFFAGYGNFRVGTTHGADDIVAASSALETGSGASDVNVGYFIFPELENNVNTLYFTRDATSSNRGFTAVKVIRPAAKDVKNTVHSLTDVKVGETSISESNLATLLSEYSVNLADESNVAPTITFNKHTVITYDDDSQKETNTPIAVTATDNGAGKWTASTTINDVVYTVTTVKVTGFAVTYHAPGATGDVPTDVRHESGVEVTVLGNTGGLARTLGGEAAAFHGWNTKADMSGTYYAANAKFTMPAEDVDLYAVWGFAINYNLDGGTINDATYATWYVSTGTETSISTPLPSNVTREGYTFDGWYTHNGIGNEVPSINAEYTGNFEGEWALKAKWILTAPIGKAQSIDMEGLVESDGTSAEWQNYLYSHGYSFSTENVSLDEKKDPSENKAYDNWPYQGLKMKKSGAYVQGTVEADKLVIIKLGHMAAAATVTIGGVAQEDATGLDAAEPAGQPNYYYVENESVLRYETTNDGACVLKAITITDPYTVSFAAHGDADPAALDGHPAVTLPTPTNGTASFLGWFTAETGGTKIGDAGESYTPSADITLHAQWEAISTDNTLSDLKVGGETVGGFSPSVHTYYVVLPYGTKPENIPAITATANSAKAKQVAIQQAVWTDEPYNCYRAQANVQAEDESWGYYDVRFSFAPKDGVSLIKVATTGGTNKTVTGVYAGDGDVSLSSSKKMDNGKYIGFTLDGTTLQAGDRINVHTTQAANTGGSHIIFYDNMTDKNELYETGEIGGLGDNIFTINAAMVGSATAYVYRANNDAAHQWNGYVDFIDVTRAMNPVLTAITIDGRDGEIDPLDDKHFNVTIPFEADLAALNVEPTIVWNGAHATTPTTVISHEGAWVLAADGDNTYRIMDKDGDYTDYTITLDRDVLKHTVSFNTHGGSAVASELVVDGESLEAAPAAPEKEDYLFQGWAETDGGAIVDVTTFAISADKEFHAVWASDGAIKLIEAGAINHTNFITGATMSESPVSIATVDYDYAKLGSTASNPSVNALNKLIAYNATTTKTKVMIDVYNKNTSARTVKIWGVVEGSSEYEELASIALDNGDNKRVKSAYYEFNNLDGKNRTIYIGVPSSVGDVAFLQVKVVESGDPIHMFGEVGYSINFNKGRLFGPSATDLAFEGMTYKLSSGYQALSSTAISLNKTSSYALTVANPVTMNVTTTNGSKFYVDQTTDGTANETASTGAHEFDLTAGTWYINVAGSNLSVSSISFAQPKAAKPVVADMDDVEYCQGSAIDALTVSATVSDGGTMLYQWYKDGEIIAGAEAATYQPTEPAADGEYYVVVVNTKAGYQNNPTQSNTITVTGHAGTAISGTTGAEDWPDAHVTISVTASGKNLSYAWYTCDDAMGTNPVAVEPAVNATELDVTVGAADTYYKVVVSGDCGSAQEAVITVVARQTVELQDVTGDMSWDFSKANDGSAATENLCNDEVLANVHGINNNDDFKSAYLKATANKFKSGKLQASMIKFHTTVDGMITVVFSNTGSKSSDRYLTVNGRKTDKGSKNETAVTYTGFVYAGDVVLGVVEGDGNMLNFTSVQFTATTSYTRPVNPSFLGTLCWTNDAILGGGTLYEFAGKDEHNYLAFDEVEENRLEAGKPYIFMPEDGNTEIKVYNTDDAEPMTESQLQPDNHMYGTIQGKTLTQADNADMYYFSSNHIWRVGDFNVNIEVPAYYCYVDYKAVLADEPAAAPAQGRRRVTMGVNGQNTTTGIGEIEASETPMKVMIDGQIFIIRGEKMYDVTGKLVK